MILIKIQCGCGQKYAFDVEPINGRMPQRVNCPACRADGTAAANEIIASQLSAPAAPVAVQNQRPDAPPPPPSQTKPKNSRMSLLVILAVVFGFAALGAGGWFVWHKQHAKVATGSASKPAPRQPNTNAAPPYLAGIKEHVALPPEIISFIDKMEQQAGKIAEERHLTLGTQLKSYFAAARAGRTREANQIFVSLRQSGDAGQAVAMDVEVAVGNFGRGDPELMLALARGMTNSLPPGCIYFGGTDPGRGLPTALCRAPGDPFFVITQNGLLDGRYLDYLRDIYGTRIQLPTTNKVSECFSNYMADVQQRRQAGALQPGEDARMENGKIQLQGGIAVMTINGLIAKVIFDKNPGREFYVEESFPLPWMRPYLSPHGLLMKLNREPLNAIPAGEIQKDQDFWSGEMADQIGDWLKKDTSVSSVCAFAEKVYANKDLSGFKGNPKFVNDPDTQKAWSKLRSSIAGVYAWRLGSQCPPEYRPQRDGARQQLVEAGDFAFRQSFAFCPYAPEAVFRYVNFLLQNKRMDDALLIARTARKCLPHDPLAPSSDQFDDLISQLVKLAKADASPNNGESMAAARINHTATLLPDGRVLVAGGFGGNNPARTNLTVPSAAELFDPAAQKWTTTGRLTDARGSHTATLLPNGKVLVAGGLNSGATKCLASAELYDPVAGTWAMTGPMTEARIRPTATLLPNGKVLVTGGVGNRNRYISTAELYDPSNGTWTVTGSMTSMRGGGHTATLLPSGKVLVAGGAYDNNIRNGIPLASAEMYDPTTGTWAATSAMAEARVMHTVTVLPDGKVLVTGGFGTNDAVLATTELFDPATRKWTTTSSMTTPRVFHTATLLSDGKVLVTGGSNSRSNLFSSTELYDPASGTWTGSASMALARDGYTATLLPGGKVLIAGGRNSNDDAINSVEILNPYARAVGGTAPRPAETAGKGNIAERLKQIQELYDRGQIGKDAYDKAKSEIVGSQP